MTRISETPPLTALTEESVIVSLPGVPSMRTTSAPPSGSSRKTGTVITTPDSVVTFSVPVWVT